MFGLSKWALNAPGTVVVGRVATGSLVCGSRLVFAPGNVEAQVRNGLEDLVEVGEYC